MGDPAAIDHRASWLDFARQSGDMALLAIRKAAARCPVDFRRQFRRWIVRQCERITS
jgi:hypothetical protein